VFLRGRVRESRSLQPPPCDVTCVSFQSDRRQRRTRPLAHPPPPTSIHATPVSIVYALIPYVITHSIWPSLAHLTCWCPRIRNVYSCVIASTARFFLCPHLKLPPAPHDSADDPAKYYPPSHRRTSPPHTPHERGSEDTEPCAPQEGAGRAFAKLLPAGRERQQRPLFLQRRAAHPRQLEPAHI
jgi:hypothetical protein